MSIEYRVLGLDDEKKTTELMTQAFITDEPQCRSLGVTSDDLAPCQEQFIGPCLTSGLSIGAFDSKTGEMVGARVSFVTTPDTPTVTMDIDNPQQEKMAKVQMSAAHLSGKVDIFSAAGQQEIVQFLCLAVKSEYRKRGIAGKLVDIAIEVSKNKGYRAIYVVASSNYSTKIFQDKGFEKLAAVRFDEFKLNGEIVFKNMHPHDWYTLFLLKW